MRIGFHGQAWTREALKSSRRHLIYGSGVNAAIDGDVDTDTDIQLVLTRCVIDTE